MSSNNELNQNVVVDEDITVATEKKKKKTNNAPMLIIPIVAGLFILTMGVVVSSFSLGMISGDKREAFEVTSQSNEVLNHPDGMFISGISVQGIDLGGKTVAEAQDLLCIAESELIPSINYTLTCNDKIVYVTENDFEYVFDTVQVLNTAYEYSEYMRQVLIEDGRTELKKSEKVDYPLSVEFIDKSINSVCKEVAKKVNVDMQDAHVTNIDVTKAEVHEMFSLAEGVVGYKLNEEDLSTQITTLINNEVYTADIIGQMDVAEPSITIKDLKENLVLISMYTTYSTNDWAGNSNMITAMSTMTGSIIKKGEVFSFNEKTGNSNLVENGYYGAGVIVNGKSEIGVGGGICQAATTIYNAAIRADMTVVERMPHTWPSTYVPVGIDSAIDYGNIDMKFQNNTDHDVYLICYMEGATLYAYIYGYKPTEFDEITVSSWFTGSSSYGFGASACRNYYKDGEIIKTESLPDSFYSPGGGTSYAYDEYPSGYEFKRVFTDEQIKEDEKKDNKKDSDEDIDTEAEVNENVSGGEEDEVVNVESTTTTDDTTTENVDTTTSSDDTTESIADEVESEENTDEVQSAQSSEVTDSTVTEESTVEPESTVTSEVVSEENTSQDIEFIVE